MTRSSDGTVSVLGFKLYYRIFEPTGEAKGTVLCLHGGPGLPHDCLLPLADLANDGYRVVFYDQLGVGKSEMPQNKYIFSIEYGVEEVEAFRKAMNLGKVNLLGWSYGGLLAIAYALKYEKNLKSLITSGGLANVPLALQEMQRMKKELPPEVISVLEKYENLGDFENLEYSNAMMVFYRRHMCRLEEWPAEVKYSLENISKPVYLLMNGPSEYAIVGSIRYWNVTDELPQIKVPTLVAGGKYDEVSTKVAESIHRGINGSKRVTFANSSHMPFWEEREKYMLATAKFLDEVNAARRVKRKKRSRA
jgi:proline iminopeptidase